MARCSVCKEKRGPSMLYLCRDCEMSLKRTPGLMDDLARVIEWAVNRARRKQLTRERGKFAALKKPQ